MNSESGNSSLVTVKLYCTISEVQAFPSDVWKNNVSAHDHICVTLKGISHNGEHCTLDNALIPPYNIIPHVYTASVKLTYLHKAERHIIHVTLIFSRVKSQHKLSWTLALVCIHYCMGVNKGIVVADRL